MHRGCISLGDIQCVQCHRTVAHSERYLTIDAEDSAGAERRKPAYYCVECALEKGYAYYKEDKGERTLTFFPVPISPDLPLPPGSVP